MKAAPFRERPGSVRSARQLRSRFFISPSCFFSCASWRFISSGASPSVSLGGKFPPNTLVAYMGDPGPSDALKKDGIHVTVPGFGTRVYSLVGDRLLLTRDEGTRTRPNVVSSLVNWEEPVAFLLERHSDIFKDATDYCDYENVKV